MYFGPEEEEDSAWDAVDGVLEAMDGVEPPADGVTMGGEAMRPEAAARSVATAGDGAVAAGADSEMGARNFPASVMRCLR